MKLAGELVQRDRKRELPAPFAQFDEPGDAGHRDRAPSPPKDGLRRGDRRSIDRGIDGRWDYLVAVEPESSAAEIGSTSADGLG